MFKYEHLGILRSMAKLAPLVAVVAVISTFLTNTISHPSVTSSVSIYLKLKNIIERKHHKYLIRIFRKDFCEKHPT